MPSGIQVNNPGTNEVQFDGTTRLLRMMTVAPVGTGNSGSVTVDTGGGEVLYSYSGGARGPQFSVSGGTVSWDYGSVEPKDRQPGLINIFVD